MIAAIYARKSTDQDGCRRRSEVYRVPDRAREAVRRAEGLEFGRRVHLRRRWYKRRRVCEPPAFLQLMNALNPRPPFQVLVMSEEGRLGCEAIKTA